MPGRRSSQAEVLEDRCLLAAVPRPDHVVIVVEENRNYEDVIGYAGAPYINSLIPEAAAFTDYHGLGHPSQPNYIALFSGSFQGVYDNLGPHSFDAPSLGGELTKAGFDFTAYSEDLPFAGFDGLLYEKYARRHAPWTNFKDVSPQDHRPLTDFPADFNDLPDVAFVIPNVVNDMHNESVDVGDAWLKQHLDPYVRWAQTHNSLFILTWDEDNLLDEENQNRIPTLMLGPMVKPGTYGDRLDHYNMLRTLEDMYGLPLLGASATARAITEAWDERPRVVGWRVFYNNSAFDGNSRFANELDDRAVAGDKHALLPGETASAENYTSYSRGINGVMLDVNRLPAALTAGDFEFKMGGGGGAEPSAWADAPRASAIFTRRGAGRAGSDRVTLTWPDGAIRNTWLRVTVKPTANTGLGRNDVFYFGNVVGDTVARAAHAADGGGGVPAGLLLTFASVGALDLAAMRGGMYAGGACGLDSRFDHNRDGRVNGLDLLTVRMNLYRVLRLLVAPPAPVADPRAAME
jgi:acid phosphatase